MAQALLHYPQNARTLNEVARQVCTDPSGIDNYVQLLAQANRRQADAPLPLHTPVILPDSQTGAPINATSIPICSFQENQRLAALSRQLGGAGTLALADLVWEITKDGVHNTWQFSKDNLTTFAGGGGAALVKTSNMILNSIDHYERELAAYELLKNHGARPETLARREVSLRKAFNQMQQTLDRKGQTFLHEHSENPPGEKPQWPHRYRIYSINQQHLRSKTFHYG